jgi:hypothetical protein
VSSGVESEKTKKFKDYNDGHVERYAYVAISELTYTIVDNVSPN